MKPFHPTYAICSQRIAIAVRQEAKDPGGGARCEYDDVVMAVETGEVEERTLEDHLCRHVDVMDQAAALEASIALGRKEELEVVFLAPLGSAPGHGGGAAAARTELHHKCGVLRLL